MSTANLPRVVKVRQERKAHNRERLLAAAGQVFARHGYHRASLEEIAEVAGLTTGAVYSNFAGKEDLFLTLLDDHIERTSAELAEAVASGATADARAHQGADHWMAFLRRDPRFFLLFMEFWAVAVRDDDVRARFKQRYERVRTSLAELIDRSAREFGIELPLPAFQLAIAVDALADGLALHKLTDPEGVSDELFGDVLSLLIRGVGQPR